MQLKEIVTIIFVLTIALLGSSEVLAQQYGEVEVVKDITVNKLVKRPGTEEWVENLFASDYKFVPQDIVSTKSKEPEFKIIVANTGTKDLENIHFKDILPAFLDYVSGDQEATFNLKKDESKTFFINTRVVRTANLPGDVCVVNTAEAWFDSQLDRDAAQVCIEKGQVLGITTIPETGPTQNLLILLGSTVLALAGWLVIKKGY